MFFIGVDPGVTGAIAVLRTEDGSYANLFDVPVVKISTRREILISEYYKLLLSIGKIDGAGIEKVNSAACPAAMTAFVLATTYAVPQALFVPMEIPYNLILPNHWKKRFSLIKKDKDASRAEASRLFPQADLKYKKHHNRADALLIARYAWETYAVTVKIKQYKRTRLLK